MQSKLIILVVLAVVAQNISEVSTISGKLLREAFNTLDQLGDSMNAMIFQEFTVAKNFFNTVRNCTEQAITNKPAENVTPNTAEALIKLKKSVDHFLTAISIATGRTCATSQTSRNALYAIVGVVMQLLEGSVDSAKTGNYPENKTEIEDYKTQLRAAFQSFAQKIVDLIKSCLNPESRDDVVRVIQTVANGIQTSFNLIADHLYNVIYIYAAAVSTDTSSDLHSALTYIDSNKVDCLEAIVSVLEYFFGGIESLYLDRVLDNTKILKYLYPAQYWGKVTLNRLNDTYEIIATTNVNTLEHRTGVIESGRLNFYPATLVNQSGSSIGLQRAINAALRGYKESQPVSTVKAEAVELIVPMLCNVLATTWFGSIALADNNGFLCRSIPAAIEVIARAEYPAVEAFVTSLFVTISNNRTTALEDISSTIPISTVNNAINHAYTANNYIFYGSQYLSKTICANKSATQADFVEIRNLLEQTTSHMIKFSKIVLRSNLIQILINWGYYPKC